MISSAETAERLANENPRYSFLTPDGTCYQGRIVTGGRPAEAGPLVMKRELRSLGAEAARLEQEVAQAQASAQALEAARLEAERALQQTVAQSVEAGKEVVAATLERDQSRSQLARLGKELAACQKEIARFNQEAQSARQRSERAVAERQQTLLAREAVTRELAEAAAGIDAMRQVAQTQQEELAAKRAEKAALDERFASAAANAPRARGRARELDAARRRFSPSSEPPLPPERAGAHAHRMKSSNCAPRRCAPNGKSSRRASSRSNRNRSRPARAQRKWTWRCGRRGSN